MKYRVHVYAIFRCPVVVEADSVEEAAKKADEAFDPDLGEYAEDIESYLVDTLDENNQRVGDGVVVDKDYTTRNSQACVVSNPPRQPGILETDEEAWAAGYRWAMEVDNETRYVKTLAEANTLMMGEFAGQTNTEIRQLHWFNVS